MKYNRKDGGISCKWRGEEQGAIDEGEENYSCDVAVTGELDVEGFAGVEKKELNCCIILLISAAAPLIKF